MTNGSKYPNADTSPERLAYIEDCFVTYPNAVAWDEERVTKQTIPFMFRDLLAMLQERADYKQEYTKCVEAASVFQSGGELSYLMEFLGQSTTLDGPRFAAAEIARLKQQLHDQRWRRFPQETPVIGQPVQIAFMHNDVMVSYTGYLFSVYEEQFEWRLCSDGRACATPDWWRPIPPLPKE